MRISVKSGLKLSTWQNWFLRPLISSKSWNWLYLRIMIILSTSRLSKAFKKWLWLNFSVFIWCCTWRLLECKNISVLDSSLGISTEGISDSEPDSSLFTLSNNLFKPQHFEFSWRDCKCATHFVTAVKSLLIVKALHALKNLFILKVLPL